MITDPSRVPLSRRAWIGNGAGGALVSADGTVDWYCPGRVQASPALWRLLDPGGGAMRIGPARMGSAIGRDLPPGEQRYLPGTNVVETVLEGGAGRRVSVTDFLAWPGPGLDIAPRIVRVVRALSGPIDVEIEVLPSGTMSPSGRFSGNRRVATTSAGMAFDNLAVNAGIPLEPSPIDRQNARWHAVRRLEEGDRFVVTVEPRADSEPLKVDGAMNLANQTLRAWRSWIAPIAYDGTYRDQVERSLLAVRSLTSGGAPAGTATTSLPRRVGSERNVDGRWVRWRDVAAAALTYAAVGLHEDSEAAETWLRGALSDATLPWPVWLDVDGRLPPGEEQLGLTGWRRSEPVVTGVPEGLVDLDGFGDVLSAVGAGSLDQGRGHRDPGPLSAAWPELAAAADWVADHWRRPDNGTWASIGPASLLVASRLGAWFALERMARLTWAANPLDLSAVPWREQAREIASWIDTAGLSAGGSLRRDGLPGTDDEPDAALLRVAWRGPWPASHPIVVNTVDAVVERLSYSGLVHRYSERVDDGRAGPDNPDLLASLWAVRALAAIGRWEEAHERMEAVSRLAGPAGLLSETADPISGELMGNLPSSSVHLALVDAAVALSAGPL